MLVLAENISVLEREKLRAMRLRARAIGETLAAFGTDDADLIPVLHRLPSPTFFTHDSDFLRRDWWHAEYALVWLDLPEMRRRPTSAASYVTRRSRPLRNEWDVSRACIPAAWTCGAPGMARRSTSFGCAPHETKR